MPENKSSFGHIIAAGGGEWGRWDEPKADKKLSCGAEFYVTIT